MVRTTFRVMILLVSFFIGNSLWAEGPVNVLTYHNDLARTGWNPSETVLKPSNVRPGKFGLLFSDKVDGQVYGQPLWVSDLNIPGEGVHNVLFITTEHDSVYAFDADKPGLPLWVDHFTGISGGVTITTVSTADVDQCFQITPEIGITDTPVIDLSTQTLYLVAMTKEIGPDGVIHFVQRLHALDLATGAEKFGGSIRIRASVSQPNSGNVFNPRSYKERCGLVLSNGVVYTFWASHCDFNHWGFFHGWVLGYDAKILQLKYVFNSTPNGSEGSFWASGAAPAVDPSGRLFLMTGNGTYDGPVSQDWGDSFLCLEADSANNLWVRDSFTPADQAVLNENDEDLGSGGPLLLPDNVGSPSHRHLLVGAGKDGMVYLVDCDQMGGYNSKNRCVQALHLQGREFGMPAYFNHNLYFAFSEGRLTQINITHGILTPMLAVGPTLGYPGAVPSISSDGLKNAILWEALGTFKHQVLRAYRLDHLKLLYQTKMSSVTKFAVPTVVNGKVYLGGSGVVQVYGLLTRLKADTHTKRR